MSGNKSSDISCGSRNEHVSEIRAMNGCDDFLPSLLVMFIDPG